MALAFEPYWPWAHISGFIASAIMFGLVFKGIRVRWRNHGKQVWTRVLVLALTGLALYLLAQAARNPLLYKKKEATGIHVSFILDVSESLLRRGGGLSDLLSQARKHWALSGMEDARLQKSTASITLVGESSVILNREFPLTDLKSKLSQIKEEELPPGNGSNLAEALIKAPLSNSAGDPGCVFLISDGNENRGSAIEAAARLTRQGVPLFYHGINSGAPGLGVVSADLPIEVEVDRLTRYRAVLYNGSPEPLIGSFKFSKHELAEGSEALAAAPLQEAMLSVGEMRPLFAKFRFKEGGLQYADFLLRSKDAMQKRRFYTFVKRPPRYLVIAGDKQWEAAFSLEEAEIVNIRPEAFDTIGDLSKFDVVIISSVTANRFPKNSLEVLADAVSDKGAGLMLFNGDHEGSNEKEKSVLYTYENTPLASLLPVSAKPRPIKEERARTIVLLIDVSGSMDGWRLQKTKNIASYIIKNQTHARDRLFIITFSTGHELLIDNQLMDLPGKEAAIAAIHSLEAGGGTNPQQALELIANRSLKHCGLVIISDGEFGNIENQLKRRPECRAYALAIRSGVRESGLDTLADVREVNANSDPRGITLNFFKNKPRNKFFERGLFNPLLTDGVDVGTSDRLPMPDLKLNGSAVSYLKEDAMLIAARPKLADPILAYREAGSGFAGVFTSAFPESWVDSSQGRDAIRAWIERVSPFTARDRYLFKVKDLGVVLELQVALVPKKDYVPQINHLNVNLKLDSQTHAIPIQADPISPATFLGRITFPRTEVARSGFLEIRESGPDALPRPQRIPIILPPKNAARMIQADEAFSYGLNLKLLEELGGMTGGGKGSDLPARTDQTPKKPVWRWFAAASFLTYILAIALERWFS